MKTSISAALGAALLSSTALGQSGPSPAAQDEQQQLNEIVVTAKPLARTVEQLAQPTAVLAGDTLTLEQSSSIGETLAEQSGVSSTYFGPIASRPVIRGQSGERVEMLANGLSALDASALSEDHAVPIDSIVADSVEIVRGPATLIHGSSAGGGIVNVVDSRIHRVLPKLPLSGTVSLRSNSATKGRRGAVKLDAGLENFVFHVDYKRHDTKNIDIPGFAESAQQRRLEAAEEEAAEEAGEEEAFGVVKNTDSETQSGAAAITLFGRNGRIGFSVSRFDTNYGIPGGHDEGHDEDDEDEGGEGEGEEEEIIRIDMEQTRAEAQVELSLDGFFKDVNLRLASNDYEHIELENAEIGTLYDNRGIDARIELEHREIGGMVGAFGLQYKRLDFEATGEEAFVPASDTEQIGLFAFEEYAIRPTLTLQGSARLEHQALSTPGRPRGYSEAAFGAALGAIWQWTDALTLSGNLALTERHPTSTELFANGKHVAVKRFERGAFTTGLGQFDKERSRNLDVTLRGDLNRVEFTVTAFLNDVSDYIVLNPTARMQEGLKVFDFGQTDARLYGFEAEALVDLFASFDSRLHLRLFADTTHGKDTRTDTALPRLTPMRYGLKLHYQRGGFDASVSARRHSKQNRVAPNELPTEAFTMVGAKISYRFDQSNVLLFLRGRNLLDEDARRHTSPLKDAVPLPGRAVIAGLRWDF